MEARFPSRGSNRLQNFDYASCGAYFITICTRDRSCIFGSIAHDEASLSPIGSVVKASWMEIPIHDPGVSTDEFVVMPNHFHGVIVLPGTGAMNRAPTLGKIVRAFKARTTVSVKRAGLFGEDQLWQRNYYEHVIRSEEDLNRVRQYIADNPKNWATDTEFRP